MTPTREDIQNDIIAQPNMVREHLQDWSKQAQQVVNTIRHRLPKIKRIYIFGHGDSQFSGLAVNLFLRKVTSLDVYSMTAMEFSKYHGSLIDDTSLAIGISLSGKTVRTVEALAVAAFHGATTIAISGKRETPLDNYASGSFCFNLEKLPQYIYGIRTYTAMLFALYFIGMQIGECLGYSDQSFADNLDCYPHLAEQTLTSSGKSAKEVVASVKPGSMLMFLGAGPNTASARYAQAKLYESASVHSIWQEIEEWAHVQCHAGSPDTVAVFFAPRGPSLVRAVEVVKGIKALGGITHIYTSVPDAFTIPGVDSITKIPDYPEELTPLLYALIGQQLSLEIALQNSTFPRRLASDPKYREVNWSLLYDSKTTIGG